jgi:hypothetical protein
LAFFFIFFFLLFDMLVVLGDCSSLGAVLTAMKGNNEELKTTIETVVRRGAMNTPQQQASALDYQENKRNQRLENTKDRDMSEQKKKKVNNDK